MCDCGPLPPISGAVLSSAHLPALQSGHLGRLPEGLIQVGALPAVVNHHPLGRGVARPQAAHPLVHACRGRGAGWAEVRVLAVWGGWAWMTLGPCCMQYVSV